MHFYRYQRRYALAMFALCSASITPVHAISVEEAVHTALTNSPKLIAVRRDAEANQAVTDRDKPVARPQVKAEAETRLQGPRVTFPRDGSGDVTVLPERYGRITLTIEQTLYRAGMGAARTRYDAQTRSTQWEVRRAENDAIQDVRKACYTMMTARTLAEVSREGRDLAKKHRDLTLTMLSAGAVSERDVHAAEADLADAEQGVLRAENGLVLSRANLNHLMGREPGVELDMAEITLPPPTPEHPEVDLNRALTTRPEIRQLQEGIRAAGAGALLAATQDKPGLSARAIAERQTESAFTNPNYFSAGLVLSWNPFDGGKTRSEVREARARKAQLEALLDEARLGIRLEMEKAKQDMAEARGRITVSDRQIAAARLAMDISELRYGQRAATQLEVSSALFGITKARAARTQAIFDLLAASADYAHATSADIIGER